MSMPSYQRIAAMTLILLISALTAAWAADDALMRVDRRAATDRNTLINDGVTLVAELSNSFLALGEAGPVTHQAAAHGLGVDLLDDHTTGAVYALVGLTGARMIDELQDCGSVLWVEDEWALLRTDDASYLSCAESPHWFLRLLDMDALATTRAEPGWMSDLAAGRATLETDPMVQEMVDSLTDAKALAHWQAIIASASTRYSTSAGCADAAADVFQLFADLGLSPEYQSHTSGHAPNVVGTINGTGGVGGEIVVIGHLDDMPSSGPAPGADDNASGAALVTAIAEAMSCYSFNNTVKLIVVTGEEFGLYGSTYYSNEAVANGDNISAVFNADMVGWEGDGSPSTEDLDINLHSSWPSLGPYLEQVATDYNTGCVINAFTCTSMTYSDHAPFWDDGFPAVCAITDNQGFCGEGGSYPYYHTSADTIANCGSGAEAFFGASTRAFLAAAAHMAEPNGRLAATPQNLSAGPAGDNRISLAWDQVVGSVTYEVSRITGGCSAGSPPVVIGETIDNSLIDTSASGSITYGYTVRARDNAGVCVSSPSACVEASTTGPCTEPPRFSGLVEALNMAEATCKVTLGWAPVEELYCGSSATYSVYRSKDPVFTPEAADRIADGLSTTAYLDDFDLESGVPYYYVVRAVDTSNDAEDGNVITGSAVPSGPVTIGTWSDDAGDTGTAKMTTTAPWSVVSFGGTAGSAVYATGDYGNNVCSGLLTPALRLGTGAQLSFASKYDIEINWDKGEVQLSTDGGSSWTRLDVGYPGSASNTGDACGLPSGDYFSGTDSTYDTYTVSLAAWSGQEVVIRWVLSSDSYVTESGWWVDDIGITQVEVPGPCDTAVDSTIFTDGFESGTTSAWSATEY